MSKVVVDEHAGRGTDAVRWLIEYCMPMLVSADLPLPGRPDGLDVARIVVLYRKCVHLAVLVGGHDPQFLGTQLFQGPDLHLAGLQLEGELFRLPGKLGIPFLKFMEIQGLGDAPDTQDEGQDPDDVALDTNLRYLTHDVLRKQKGRDTSHVAAFWLCMVLRYGSLNRLASLL